MDKPQFKAGDKVNTKIPLIHTGVGTVITVERDPDQGFVYIVQFEKFTTSIPLKVPEYRLEAA